MRGVIVLLLLLCVVRVGSRGGRGGGGRGSGSSRLGGGNRGTSGGGGWRLTGGGYRYSGSRRNYGHVYGYHSHHSPVYMYGGKSLVLSPIHGWNGYRDPTWVHGFMIGSMAIRCTRPISDLGNDEMEKFINNTSEKLKTTELAWPCPADHVCCGWECCEDPDAKISTLTWMLIGLGIFVGILILIGCAYWICACVEDSQQMTVYEQKPQQAAYPPPPAYNPAHNQRGYGSSPENPGFGSYPVQVIH